ncbi:MAG: GAF and ANTAR domain-containing protein [Acidobacteria bacterium]|nr:GAF and ANTAR domain-containing protein [Acidobacteriota bacterium]
MSETDASSREARLSAAFVTLADTLTSRFDLVDLLHTLVDTCTSLLNVAAGGLILADARSGELHVMASSSEDAALLEVVQLGAADGPCLECFRTGRAVTVGDLDQTDGRWPAFSAAALDRGFRSMHATPMRLRDRVIGTMNLFGREVGELNAPDIAVAQALTDVATIGILQERLLRESKVVGDQLQHALESRIVIEQAKGVLAQSAALSMDDSFRSMRAYARGQGLPLQAVAAQVVARTIDIFELTDKSGGQGPAT